MNTWNRTPSGFLGSVALLVCSTLITAQGYAATPRLASIAVTPAASSISVGQKQAFTATGTFNDGSKHVLGPDISDIAPGFETTCALLRSGGAECWGHNYQGILGNGNRVDSLIPRAVKNVSTATEVALGEYHGCALLANGSVKCWGYNGYGELGNGTNQTSSVPVPVSSIGTATAVALGNTYSCALLADGSVKCWGSNIQGELGDGSNTNSNVPVPVSGISTATALATGHGAHSCVLLPNRTIQCWGYNFYGQLGNGTTTNAATPVHVAGIGSAIAVAVGLESSCAVLASGAVQCWGDNSFGQFGNGSTKDSLTPVPVTGISTATAITAGSNHYCAILQDGFVECWGANAYGQLGNGTRTTYTNLPVRVRAITQPSRLVAGSESTCALFSGGVMRCWGQDNYGQLGDRQNKVDAHSSPVTVVGTPGVVWKSSDPTRATITDRGVATGLAGGNTTITATTTTNIDDSVVLTVK